MEGARIRKMSKGSFEGLVKARRSIRNFSTEPVDEGLIEEAVRLAQFSPSACNRQGTYVFYTLDHYSIDKILELQNGNRGFGHLAKTLIIVTADRSVSQGVGERKQAILDSGIFAMSLLYGLSYVGLGSCPLNWSVTPEADASLRKLVNIPETHEVSMLIAAGHLPEKVAIANSARNKTHRILMKFSVGNSNKL